MLGYITTRGQGAADRLLADVAHALLDRGVAVAGVVQENIEKPQGGPCDMVLHVLMQGRAVAISQNLGPLSKGCRLDASALEEAAGLVAQAMAESEPALVIVNKFGKQEAEGRGFRPLIGEALGRGIPVLVAVGEQNRAAFDDYAGDFGENIAAEPDAVMDWVRAATGADLGNRIVGETGRSGRI